jgi:hypothetical protein
VSASSGDSPRTEVITCGQAILSRIDEWLAAHQSACAQKVRDCQQWLRDDLDIHAGLLAEPASPEYQHPSNVYPDLGAHANAIEMAVERITQDIADSTAALIAVVSECCGQEAEAQTVSGIPDELSRVLRA